MSGDKELKSAFELAMARAQNLGDMSAEDKKKHKESELAEVAQALGKRYLMGLPIRDIESDLVKYKEDRQIVVRHLLSFLSDQVFLMEPDKAEAIVRAIEHFTGKTVDTAKFSGIVGEYKEAMEAAWSKAWDKLSSTKRKELAKAGISGSAVEPVVENSEEWVKEKRSLDALYEERLKRAILPPQTF